MLTTTNDTVEAQDKYVEQLQKEGFDYGLIVAEAFVKGMRDVGYRHTGTALAELVDNSIEASAEHVHVVFGYAGAKASQKKPQQVAVIDDGHGMSPGMIRAAVLWGGSHRTGSRELFGRYGFGLPSSSVSQGRRFEVFSRTDSGEWHSVAIDLDEIAAGECFRDNGTVAVPPAEPRKLPAWLVKEVRERFADGLGAGTIVVLDKLDNLTYVTTTRLKRLLAEHFGLTYRKWLRRASIHVEDTKVEPIDPLFLDESGRFYDENELRAEGLEETLVPVKNASDGTELGTVRVRYSYLPPGFQNQDGKVRRKTNKRFNVMKENNGILVLRAGRQIDVVSVKCPWLTFVNYHRNWKVEIDFDPSLDEQFSITTSKQQIVVSERMWQLLDKAGVRRTMEELKSRYTREVDAKKQEEDSPEADEPRSSEEIMRQAEKYKTPVPEPDAKEKAKREERKRREITRRAKESRKREDEVAEEIEAEIEQHPWKMLFEDLPGAPFYRTEAMGYQLRLCLNRTHPFFTQLYMGPDSTPRQRVALEVLLFVLAEAELDANQDGRLFYETERQGWSTRLNVALKILDEMDPAADAASAEQDEAESRAASEEAAGE